MQHDVHSAPPIPDSLLRAEVLTSALWLFLMVLVVPLGAIGVLGLIMTAAVPVAGILVGFLILGAVLLLAPGLLASIIIGVVSARAAIRTSKRGGSRQQQLWAAAWSSALAVGTAHFLLAFVLASLPSESGDPDWWPGVLGHIAVGAVVSAVLGAGSLARGTQRARRKLSAAGRGLPASYVGGSTTAIASSTDAQPGLPQDPQSTVVRSVAP